jgi:hypothetical protein
MKMIKLVTVMIAFAILSVVSLSYGQRASFSVHVGGGGYYGGGHYGGYNHYGYAGAPYVGVATGPIGYAGYGPGYGPRPGRCAWNHYYHQWNCW